METKLPYNSIQCTPRSDPLIKSSYLVESLYVIAKVSIQFDTYLSRFHPQMFPFLSLNNLSLADPSIPYNSALFHVYMQYVTYRSYSWKRHLNPDVNQTLIQMNPSFIHIICTNRPTSKI